MSASTHYTGALGTMVSPPSPLRAVSVPCPGGDLPACYGPWGAPSVYLDCPEGGWGIFGAGVLRELGTGEPSGVAPLLEQVTGDAGRLEPLDALSEDVPGPWFGGTAFDVHRRCRAPEWHGFGLARFIVPERLLWRSAAGWVATELLGADTSEDEGRHRLAERVRLLHTRASRPAAPSWSARVERTASEGYLRAVEGALHAIDSRGLTKVMVARALEVRGAAPFPLPELLGKLRQRFPSCVTFLLQGADGTAFLGATPERLCRIEDGTVLTEALAGTAHPDAAEALLASEKDLREHRAVVEGIGRALAPFTSSFHAAPAPAIKRLPNVVHLHTPIEATLSPGSGPAAVLRALHPTPSVGGTPRERAFAFLAEHEGLERGWYAGPFGVFGSRRVEAYVALRCALVEADLARVYVGAGIVAGSTPDAELRETSLKAKVLLDALNASEHGP